MTEEELDATGALVVDEDQDELLEELSLEERKEGLKKARWNVFLYLGVAAILFFFALFPMPFSADYDGLTYSAEKDIGLVWGLPLDGEDLFDVPMRLTVLATTPPAVTEKIDIGVYVIQQEDCTDYAMSEKMEEAKSGDSHAYQYQEANQAILAEKSYEFEFNIDPGQYCIVSWYIYENGDPVTGKSMELSVDGKLYPNQFFGGLAGLVCLSLSGFAFVGAQRHGSALRKLLEGENESTESKVLSEASQARIAAGPSGPPQAGPSGPPPAAGPSAPPQASPAEDEGTPAPAQQEATLAPSEPAAQPPVSEPPHQGTFEPAENGYFFRKMPDGTYDQTVYVQNESGAYVPYEA